MVAAIKESLPNGGNIALLTGVPGNPTAASWQPLVEKKLPAAGNYKIVYKGTTNWTPAGELQAASAIIAKGEQVDGIIYDGAGPQNLIKGYQRAGKKLPTFVASSPDNTYYQLWKQIGSPKDQYITDSQTWMGRVAVTAAIDRKLGKQVPGNLVNQQLFVQTAAAQPYWGPSLDWAPTYLPPTFLGQEITKFNQ
jgi:ABC-type sugar transport system substrate-binding protein